jgi:MFS family permease
LAVDRFGPRRLTVLNLLLFTIGSAVFTVADNLVVAALSLLANGVAQGIAWPASQSLIAATVPSAQQQRFFGINFTLLNLGIGFGGIAGNLLVDAGDAQSLQVIYAIDAVGYLPALLLMLGPLRHLGGKPLQLPRTTGRSEVGYPTLLRQPMVASLFALGFLSSFVGVSQLRTGMPAFARSVADLSTHTLGLIFTIDTAVIIGAQMLVLRRLEGRRRTRALGALGLLWAGAWMILAMSGAASGTGAATLFALAFAVVFGFGETLRPIIPSLVNDLAPTHLRGRYNAINAAGFQLAGVLAPPIAGLLIGSGRSSAYIAMLVAGALILAVFAVRFVEPRLPLHANGVHPVESEADPTALEVVA